VKRRVLFTPFQNKFARGVPENTERPLQKLPVLLREGFVEAARF
jgi:hypothetical protein